LRLGGLLRLLGLVGSARFDPRHTRRDGGVLVVTITATEEAIRPVHEIVAVAEVILIDIALAADNAIVVGLAASRVPPQTRRQAIVWGISGAVMLRLLFAGLVSELFSIIGLTLAGGLLLLWVCWKMFRELRGPTHHNGLSASAPSAALWRAVARMVVADVSMSLDNVLAIAGAARGNLLVLAIGLIVSVSLMATASTLLARLLERLPWIAWLGLLIVVFVAFDMIWRGLYEIDPHLMQWSSRGP
jgi:YjbE family integral membrane protein